MGFRLRLGAYECTVLWQQGSSQVYWVSPVWVSVYVVFLYQLWYVVDDDQVGPGVSEAEVGFIVNPTELTDPADRAGNNQQNIQILRSNTLRRLFFCVFSDDITFPKYMALWSLFRVMYKPSLSHELQPSKQKHVAAAVYCWRVDVTTAWTGLLPWLQLTTLLTFITVSLAQSVKTMVTCYK